MNQESNTWVDYDAPLDEATIRAIGAQVNVDLPDDFVRMARQFHGGRPIKDRFQYVEPDGISASALSLLYSFDLTKKWNFLYYNQNPPEEMPEGLIIIGTDGGGGFICFDYRNSSGYPPVVFWSNDTPSAETVIPLAQTFTEFLRNLREPEPY